MTDFKQTFTGPGNVALISEGTIVHSVEVGPGAELVITGTHTAAADGGATGSEVQFGRYYNYIYYSHPPSLDALTKPPHNYPAGALQIVPEDANPDDPSAPSARGGRSRMWAVLDPKDASVAPEHWKIRGAAK